MKDRLKKFGVRFDFDYEGEAPTVLIADKDGYGTAYLEVFEEPKCKVGTWSWDGDDWECGSIAKALIKFMNSSHYLKR